MTLEQAGLVLTALVASAVAALGMWLVVRRVNLDAQQRLVPRFIEVLCLPGHGVTPERIGAALELACEVLAGHWPLARRYVQGWTIEVMPDESWGVDRRAGSCNPDAKRIRVGPSLSALAHELVHVCEYATVGSTSFKHEDWSARGLFEACARYQGRLERGPS